MNSSCSFVYSILTVNEGMLKVFDVINVRDVLCVLPYRVIV
jgi:hypothetical protein